MVKMTNQVNIQMSPDENWYGIYRFSELVSLNEADKVLGMLKETVSKEGHELSDKIALLYNGETWALRITVKGMSSINEAGEMIKTLGKTILTYKPKGQKSLD